jgi:hypothetical protein
MKAFLLGLGIVSIFLFAIPDPTFAAGLVPEVCEDGSACSACHLIELANNVIKWLIGVLTIIFAVVVVVAGFKLVTSGGNTSARDSAKEMVTNALIGFILVLAAWLIIDTIMKGLLPDGMVNGKLWYQSISCEDFTQTDPNLDGEYAVVEMEAFREGGDSNVESSGLPASPSSNCPVPPASSMVVIPTKYTGGRSIRIRPDILANFEKMYAEAKADGVTLTIRSGWRDEQMQLDAYRTYKGVSAVAIPCSLSNNKGGSNHNSGTAIDVVLNSCRKTTPNCRDPIFLWLKEKGGKYGFRNTFTSGYLDNVHWSPSGR